MVIKKDMDVLSYVSKKEQTETVGFEEACKAAALELAELVIKKHQDYGEENILTFGELGVLVRCSDKVARLRNILQNNLTVQYEGKMDSWKDLGGYSIIALMLNNNTFK
uniref:Nucleotide modification associated domain-containing protein n=1 Tax=viral metagenome TaxID=1070528 RepID=A0A6M3IHB2_9ZZZZ